jgi:heavy metal sensor kinase
MKSLHGLIRQSALILIAGLLLVFSIVIYAGGDTLMRRFVDARLLGLAETLAKIVEHNPDFMKAPVEDPVVSADVSRGEKEQLQVSGVTHSLRVFSPEGVLLWKRSDAETQQPMTEHVFEQARLGHVVVETVESVDGTAVRHLFLPIFRDGRVQYVLQAEASLRLYRETLKELLLLLTMGAAAILLVAWLGSGWLAKKVLSPLAVLSTEAETMCEADLGKRLMLGSPYQEFRRLTQAFNSVMDRFQRSVESQRRFVDHAAHEMQTPLTVMQGHLEVTLLKARTHEEYREALINNLEQVGRLISLTRSLLTLAKFTGDTPPVHLAPLALGALIHDLLAELKILFDERRITLSFESQPVPNVHGDAQWIKQAVMNLLDNALRYTPSGGTVTVRLETAGQWVAVIVEDTGHGIEPEHLPHLFERFYRTDWARAKDSGGTGLGLPIVKGIAAAHGGTIAVTSRVNEGSVFTLRLPIPIQETVPRSAALRVS